MEFKRIVEMFEDAGYEPRSYSGRAMYGARCLSVNIGRGSTAFVVAKVLEEAISHADAASTNYAQLVDWVREVGELAQELGNAREDSMGRGSVIYWPGLEWEGEEGSEDDEE